MKKQLTQVPCELIEANQVYKKRVMVGIPMTGLLRSEWVLAKFGQVIPCNWSQTEAFEWLGIHAPLGFLVAEARNMLATKFVEQEFEWLFFIDHDVMLPPATILTWSERMMKGDIPMWSGLYFTKSVPAEPLVYRGHGNGYFANWKIGDQVWVDGLPMGCTMIHHSIMKMMYDESEEYMVNGQKIRRIFETPAKTIFDPEQLSWFNVTGTEDLKFCDDVIKKDILRRAGWKDVAKKKYPYLIDTRIFCKHIEFNGIQYPARGEELNFMGYTDAQKIKWMKALDQGKKKIGDIVEVKK